MNITIRHVVRQHKAVNAVVHDDDNVGHHIAHLANYGWSCLTHDSPTCRSAIDAIRTLVDPMEDQ